MLPPFVYGVFIFIIDLCFCPSEALSLISRQLGLPLDLSASEGLRKHDKTADHRTGGMESKTPQVSYRAVQMAQPALPEAVRPALIPQEGDAGSPPSTHEGKRNRRENTDEEKKRSCEVQPPADPYGRSSGAQTNVVSFGRYVVNQDRGPFARQEWDADAEFGQQTEI
ncbi:hypothetical protein GGI43DRAFT_383666 [Trichoderma evansii]